MEEDIESHINGWKFARDVIVTVFTNKYVPHILIAGVLFNLISKMSDKDAAYLASKIVDIFAIKEFSVQIAILIVLLGVIGILIWHMNFLRSELKRVIKTRNDLQERVLGGNMESSTKYD